MIISHTHKFVFVAVSKTGTTSLQSILREYNDEVNPHKILKHPRSQPNYRKHAPLYVIREVFNVDDYFSFCFVRNPWSRTVSRWHYTQKIASSEDTPYGDECRQQLLKCKTFKDYILYTNTCIQSRFVLDKHGNNIVDFIGKFENLQQDFNKICDKIGIPKHQLSHKNATKHKHYTEYYDDETRQIVAEKYAKDIEMFGYEFGE